MSDSQKIITTVILGVIVVVLIISLAILIHRNQKLDACEKITENAARIICISQQ